MSNLVLSRELSEKKLATLTEGLVKENLNTYFTSMQGIAKSTWTAYKAFSVAYANMASEKVKNPEGLEIDRFKTKGQFYDFVGVNDSTGSLMLRAVGFNAVFSIDGKSLEDMGFSAGKVDMLSRVGEYKPAKGEEAATYDAATFTKFLNYVAKRIGLDITALATMSDASLKALIKEWTEEGKPEEPKPMQEKQEKQEKQETIEEKQETTEEKQEITRETIFSYIDGYTGGDLKKVSELIKMIKKHYGIR